MMKLFLVVIVSALASATAQTPVGAPTTGAPTGAPNTEAPTTEAPTTGSPTGAPTTAPIATYTLHVGGKGMNCATGFHLEDEAACSYFANENSIDYNGITASSDRPK